MPVTEDCFIGVDLGTSGCRAIAIDGANTELAYASVPVADSRRNENGASEQDPENWWQAVIKALRGLTERLKDRQVRGLALDGTSSTLVLCAAEGELLGPAMMYDDSRGIDQLERIRQVAPPTAAVHNAGSSLAKLLYRLNQGGLPAGFRALHQADWIVGCLTGHFDVSDDNNCLKLGYDSRSNEWPRWLDQLGVPSSCLPRVVRPGRKIGELIARAADATGLEPGIPIFAGTTDSTAACMAAGATQVGDAVSVLGSTLVLKVLAEEPVVAAGYGVYSQRYQDFWLVGGASNSGGAVLRSFFTPKQMARLTARLIPDQPTNLDYYPLLHPGERFPVNDPNFVPRLTPRPDDDALFLQGLLEGVARIERDGYLLLERLGAPRPSRIHTIGGGASNRAWTRIRQRILELPIQNAAHEQAAYGTALLARHGYLAWLSHAKTQRPPRN